MEYGFNLNNTTVKFNKIQIYDLVLDIMYKGPHDYVPGGMGQQYEISKEYFSKNRKTRLVDLKMISSKLVALEDKLHGLPFPGINMDNLPFFVPIVSMAKGRTLVHDWVYEVRAIYFAELNRLGAQVTLLDPHRVYIEGPVKFSAAEMMSPPALRPAAIILVRMNLSS